MEDLSITSSITRLVQLQFL